MPSMTSSQVKNYIRRAFREAIDKSPTRERELDVWIYFRSCCAYCNALLDRDRKEGHIDHLISASAGGTNHLSNRVLACARCNEGEKRERDWQEFLREKAPDALSLEERRARILAWQAKHGSAERVTPELVAQADRLAAEVNAVFDDRMGRLRAMRDAASTASPPAAQQVHEPDERC